MEARRYQEFYCRSSGGGCGGYVMIPVTSGGTYKVQVTCPKCKHVHDRAVVNGVIEDRDRMGDRAPGKAVVEILPTMSAWSATPRTRAMLAGKKRRDRFDEQARRDAANKDLSKLQRLTASVRRARSRMGSSRIEPEAAAVAAGRDQFLEEAWQTMEASHERDTRNS